MPPYKSHERLMIVVLKAAPRLKVIVYNWAGTKWEASTARTIELQRCVENNRWELGMLLCGLGTRSVRFARPPSFSKWA